MTSASTENSTRQILLDTGRDIVREVGLRRLTVRGVSQRASVNPGSFVYHFGSREAFIDELIEGWYAPLFAKLLLETKTETDPVNRVRSLVLQLVRFLEDNGAFVNHLFMDAMAGEAGARRFLASVPQRHPKLLLEALRHAQTQGLIVVGDPLHMLVFIMASVGLPMVLVHGVLGQMDKTDERSRRLVRLVLEPDAAEQRLDWALKGIAPDAANRRRVGGRK